MIVSRYGQIDGATEDVKRMVVKSMMSDCCRALVDLHESEEIGYSRFRVAASISPIVKL